MQYHEAFEESTKLLEMVFWRGNIDHDYLLGEINAIKGAPYVASRQQKAFTAKQLGGNLSRPTFGPASRSGRDPDTIITSAIEIVMQRLYDLIHEQRLYPKLDKDARERFRYRLEGITETVLSAEQHPKI
jgi:hypothetical protein